MRPTAISPPRYASGFCPAFSSHDNSLRICALPQRQGFANITAAVKEQHDGFGHAGGIGDAERFVRSARAGAHPFCLQSFLVQTHVHPLGAASGPATISISAPHDGKAPLDADHCLLCQEYVHAGAYVTPAAAAVLPPSIAVSVVALSEAPFLLARQISRNWMGRAPPRA